MMLRERKQITQSTPTQQQNQHQYQDRINDNVVDNNIRVSSTRPALQQVVVPLTTQRSDEKLNYYNNRPYERFLQQYETSTTLSKSNGLSLGIIAGIGAGAAFVLVSLILLVMYFFCNGNKTRSNGSRDSSKDTKNINPSIPIHNGGVLSSSTTNNFIQGTSNNGALASNPIGLTPREKKTFVKLVDDDVKIKGSSKDNKRTSIKLFSPNKQQQQQQQQQQHNGGRAGTAPDPEGGFLRVWDSKGQGNKKKKVIQTIPIVHQDEREPPNSISVQRGRFQNQQQQQQRHQSSQRVGADDESLWGDDLTMYTERDENGLPRRGGRNPSYAFTSSQNIATVTDNDADSLISGTDPNGNYHSSNRSMMTYAYSLEAGNIDDGGFDAEGNPLATGILNSDGEYTDSNNSIGVYAYNDGIEVSQDLGGDSLSLGNEEGDNSSYDTRQVPHDDITCQDTNTTPDNMIRRTIIAPAGKLGIIIDTTSNGPVVYDVNPNSVVANKIFPGDIFIQLNDINTRHMSAIAITELVQKTNNLPRKLTVLSSLNPITTTTTNTNNVKKS